VKYNSTKEHGPESKLERMMRVLLESIEDLYFLSRTDVILTQMTSHYSTYAALLSWASTGAVDPDSIVYLDSKSVINGKLQCALLHGGNNLTYHTNDLDRWHKISRKFYQGISQNFLSSKTYSNFSVGLPQYVTVDNSFNISDTSNMSYNIVEFDPHHDNFRATIIDNLPTLPEIPLRLEISRWLGGNNLIWPGECPVKRNFKINPLLHVSDNINLGTDHHVFHFQQAAKCWLEAYEGLADLEGHPKYDEYYDVVTSNLDILRKNQMYPYSISDESIKKFYEMNIGYEM
jgi:hypothetical protein